MNTCFIVGNGPSFNRFPMNLPDEVPTFGMNYCGFQPMYYVCVDSDILVNYAEEIEPYIQNSKIAFLSELHKGENVLYNFPNVRLVGKDTQSFKAETFMSGLTSAYVCLKLAYYMGFDDVHLYAIDHSPAWDHYRSDYRIGKKTNASHMAIMRQHYQLAMNVYSRAGRRIINHSNPSALDAIFPRA